MHLCDLYSDALDPAQSSVVTQNFKEFPKCWETVKKNPTFSLASYQDCVYKLKMHAQQANDFFPTVNLIVWSKCEFDCVK